MLARDAILEVTATERLLAFLEKLLQAQRGRESFQTKTPQKDSRPEGHLVKP
jgi:hypothetical protein